jgi:hypothetical protein
MYVDIVENAQRKNESNILVATSVVKLHPKFTMKTAGAADFAGVIAKKAVFMTVIFGAVPKQVQRFCWQAARLRNGIAEPSN